MKSVQVVLILTDQALLMRWLLIERMMVLIRALPSLAARLFKHNLGRSNSAKGATAIPSREGGCVARLLQLQFGQINLLVYIWKLFRIYRLWVLLHLSLEDFEFLPREVPVFDKKFHDILLLLFMTQWGLLLLFISNVHKLSIVPLAAHFDL